MHLSGGERRLIVVVERRNEGEVGTGYDLLELDVIGGIDIDISDIVPADAVRTRGTGFITREGTNDCGLGVTGENLYGGGRRADRAGLGNQGDRALRGRGSSRGQVDETTGLLNDVPTGATCLHFQARVQAERVSPGVIGHIGADGDVSAGSLGSKRGLNLHSGGVIETLESLAIARRVGVKLSVERERTVHHHHRGGTDVSGCSGKVGNRVQNGAVHPDPTGSTVLIPDDVHVTGATGTLIHGKIEVTNRGLVLHETLCIASVGTYT